MDLDTIRNAFQALSDELGRRGAAGELCLLGGTVLQYYPAARIPIRAKYLLEEILAEER